MSHRFSCTIALIAWSVLIAPISSAQSPNAQRGYAAEVTADDVYVRSGPSTNYYPVTKLSTGDPIRIIEEAGEWNAIIPPGKCYSIIAKEYVDVGDGRHGVVNGDNVRVRAGSLIEDKTYAVQIKLSKGAPVEILGDNGQGFYQIVPPAEAKLWISSKFTRRIPDKPVRPAAAPATGGETPPARTVANARPLPKQPEPAASDPSTNTVPTAITRQDPQSRSTPPAQPAQSDPRLVPTEVVNLSGNQGPAAEEGDAIEALADLEATDPSEELAEVGGDAAADDEIEEYGHNGNEANHPHDPADYNTYAQPVTESSVIPGLDESPPPAPVVTYSIGNQDMNAMVEQLDAELKTELQKPLIQRQLQPFVDRFTPLAQQTDDEFIAVYASTRIEQIKNIMDMINAVRSVQQVGNQLTTDREVALAGRKQARAPFDESPSGFNAEGILRTSAVFDSTPGPVRYRLVADGAEPVRTLGYVEITPESGLNPESLIGQKVGVRASEVYYTSGDVNPIKIFVAAELVPLASQPLSITPGRSAGPTLPVFPVSAPPAQPTALPAANLPVQRNGDIPTLPVETLDARPAPAHVPPPAPARSEPVEAKPVETVAKETDIAKESDAPKQSEVIRPTKKSSTDPDVLIIESKPKS
jgi:hypothetical protein